MFALPGNWTVPAHVTPPAPKKEPESLTDIDTAGMTEAQSRKVANLKYEYGRREAQIKDLEIKVANLQAAIEAAKPENQVDLTNRTILLQKEQIAKLAERDNIQRNNIYNLDKHVSELLAEVRRLKEGRQQSEAEKQVVKVREALKTHAFKHTASCPQAKEDSALPCSCFRRVLIEIVGE